MPPALSLPVYEIDKPAPAPTPWLGDVFLARHLGVERENPQDDRRLRPLDLLSIVMTCAVRVGISTDLHTDVFQVHNDQ